VQEINMNMVLIVSQTYSNFRKKK